MLSFSARREAAVSRYSRDSTRTLSFRINWSPLLPSLRTTTLVTFEGRGGSDEPVLSDEDVRFNAELRWGDEFGGSNVDTVELLGPCKSPC
jgi:hypothetical protein